jgi:hypothetical protein
VYESTVPIGVERGWYDAFRIAFSDPRSVAVKSDTIPEAGWQQNEAVLFPDKLIEALASGGSL